MAYNTKLRERQIYIPLTLSQIAEGLRKLSRRELETLEFLFDKKAMATIKRSLAQAKRGKLKEL